jgi:hypothetical protein
LQFSARPPPQPPISFCKKPPLHACPYSLPSHAPRHPNPVTPPLPPVATIGAAAPSSHHPCLFQRCRLLDGPLHQHNPHPAPRPGSAPLPPRSAGAHSKLRCAPRPAGAPSKLSRRFAPRSPAEAHLHKRWPTSGEGTLVHRRSPGEGTPTHRIFGALPFCCFCAADCCAKMPEHVVQWQYQLCVNCTMTMANV